MNGEEDLFKDRPLNNHKKPSKANEPLDYQSRLLASSSNSKPSVDPNNLDLMQRPSDDPFTVSMRETAQMEIEHLNNQVALLNRLKETDKLKQEMAEEEAMRDTKEQLNVGYAFKDISRRSLHKKKNPHLENNYEELNQTNTKSKKLKQQPPMMILN